MSAVFQGYRIPFTATPQSFDISLRGRLLNLTNRWNYLDSTWRVDVIDSITNEVIVLSIPLVTGADLLKQYAYLNLGGSIYVYTNSAPAAPPTYTNLGSDSNVYFLVEQ